MNSKRQMPRKLLSATITNDMLACVHRSSLYLKIFCGLLNKKINMKRSDIVDTCVTANHATSFISNGNLSYGFRSDCLH